MTSEVLALILLGDASEQRKWDHSLLYSEYPRSPPPNLKVNSGGRQTKLSSDDFMARKFFFVDDCTMSEVESDLVATAPVPEAEEEVSEEEIDERRSKRCWNVPRRGKLMNSES